MYGMYLAERLVAILEAAREPPVTVRMAWVAVVVAGRLGCQYQGVSCVLGSLLLHNSPNPAHQILQVHLNYLCLLTGRWLSSPGGHGGGVSVGRWSRTSTKGVGYHSTSTAAISCPSSSSTTAAPSSSHHAQKELR